MPNTLVQCTPSELQKCPNVTSVQSCSYDCFCSEYDLHRSPNSCGEDQVFIEYKIQFIDRMMPCFGCVDCTCEMKGYKRACGAGEKVVDTLIVQCPDCRTSKRCVLCGPDDLDPCRGSNDPCCGNLSTHCCDDSTDPCCGVSSDDCNPCQNSPDPYCGCTEPCCPGDPDCDPCLVNPDAEECKPCPPGSDACCGSTDKCCGDSDPCCGVDQTCENGCADYCACHPEDPDCQPKECNPPVSCGPCEYETTGCGCDAVGDACCEDPDAC